MKTTKLKKTIQLSYEKIAFLNLVELTIYAKEFTKSENESTKKENLLLLQSINQIKQKLNKQLKLQINNLKLVNFVNKHKKQRFHKNIKKAFLIVCSLGAFYYPSLKIVNAVEKMPGLFENTKKTWHNFIFEKDNEGNQSLNIKNVVLGSLTAITLGGLVVYFLNEDNEYSFNRLLFKRQIFPIVEVAMTLQEKEAINQLLSNAKDDVNRGQFVLDRMSKLSSFKKLTTTTFEMTETSQKTILRTFCRVMLNAINTKHQINKYTLLEEGIRDFLPHVSAILTNDTLSALKVQQREFIKIVQKMVANQGQLKIARNYFENNVETLVQRDDLSTNSTLLKETVTILVHMFNETLKKENY